MRAVFLLAMLTGISAVMAQPFYADVIFDVQPDGSVQISGTTNHPLLDERTTQEFTNKEKMHWLLNITLPERFSDYVFTVILPEGATLSYANGKALNIATENNHVTIKSYGQDGSLSIVAQYSIVSARKNYLVEILSSILAAAAICGILVLAYWHGKRKQKATAKFINDTNAITLRDGLSKRQQDILSLLDRSGGALTQKQIEKTLELPKASISRNIESLRQKGLIERQQAGMSNVVRLAK